MKKAKALCSRIAKFPSPHRILLVTSALTCFCITNVVFAGAWVPEKGRGFSKLGYQSYKADDYFGSNPDFKEFKGINLSYYGELGLGKNTAIYGTLLYQDIEQTDAMDNTVDSTGFGDVEIGLRYQWLAEPVVLSTSFLVKLPQLYDEDDELPRGNGQEDYEVRVLVGKSLYPYGYFNAELGYRYRTDSPSDEYRYLLEYGISANDNLYLRSKLDAIKSANNADTINVGTENASLGAEFDLGKLELTAGWNFGAARERSLGRTGLEFTYSKDIYGDNIIEGDAFQIGLTRVF